MLTRNRPTPGTPMAKSDSFVSMNSLSCRGCISCSASALRFSGVNGGRSSCSSSPDTRTVGARPTLSNRSEPLRFTISVMACLKNAAAPCPCAAAPWADMTPVVPGTLAPGGGPMTLRGPAGSDIGLHPEQHLAELDRLRVLDEHVAHHT